MRRIRMALVGGICGLTGMATLLVSCSAQEPSAGPSTSSVSSSPSFNEADVAFVVDAGTHLLSTVTAAQLAEDRSSNPAVLRLARRLIALKGPQADRVAGWVNAWGRQGGDLAHDSAEHSQPDRPGGLTSDVMSRLGTLSGPRFDRLFLASLAEHLQQGQRIWQSELRQGSDPGATRLAARIMAEDKDLLRSCRRLLDR